MALDFNTTPYYDDFDENKNFHRILFRPGRAVQARELTQSQTLLQDQVKKFGDHIFKDGSRVTGAELFSIGEGRVKNIDLTQQPTISHINVQSTTTDTGASINVASFIGKYVAANTGNTNYAANNLVRNIYFIHHADAAVGSDPDTLYVSHLRTNNFSQANISTANTIVTGNVGLQIYNTDDIATANLFIDVKSSTGTPFGQSKLLGVANGVFFTNGVFVKNPEQVIAVDKYSANANVSVGFEVTESIVKSTDDTTLLDPALDSSNYLAPGGDRYKVQLTLSKKDLDTSNASLPSLTSTKFIELVRYKSGQLVKDTSATRYSDLGRTLARRTFDESGDYVVSGLEPRLKPIGNSTNFLLNISKGKAYVKGYEINQNLADVKLNVRRARDQESVTGYDIETPYGNFFNITNSNNAVFNSNVSERVELHSSNTIIDGTTLIGEAYVRNQEYVSGGANTAIHKLFLFDVKRIANTGGTNLPISLTKHIRGMQSGNANCNIHSTSVSTFETTGSVVNNSQHIVVSNPSGILIGDEVFGHNVSQDLYSSDRRVYVTAKVGSNISLSNTVISNSVSNTYTFQRAALTDTNQDIGVFEGTYDVVSSVNNINYNTRRVFKSVTFSGGTVTINTNDGTERFKDATTTGTKRQFYQIIIRTASGSQNANDAVDLSDASVTFNSTSTPGNPDALTIDINDASFNGTADILTTIDITGSARRSKVLASGVKGGNSGAGFTQIGNAAATIVRSLGVTDLINVTAIYISNDTASIAGSANNNVVDLFFIDTGQTDSFYDHATIRLKESAIGEVNTGNVRVEFNRYTHTGVGHFDANSYPVYEEIPQYIKKDGTKIDLRDSIDFRPTRSDDTTSNVFSNTAMTFSRNQMVDSRVASVDTNLSYYLSRIDKAVLGFDGEFRIIEGQSRLNNPPTPEDDPESMTLYKLTFPPFTYTTSNVKVDIVKNKRYTMKDIGGIDDRLSRVEYYTSLNLLEQEISSSSFFKDDNTQLINNGFIVDDFKGHSVGDVLNPDYKCSIDYTNKILHPRFKANGTNVSCRTGSTLANTNGTLTLPFTTSVYTGQNVASGITNINPFNVVSFVGYVDLKTDVTSYADFRTRPIVGVNTDGNSDNYGFGVNFEGSKWDEWLALAYNSDETRFYTYYDTKQQKVVTTSSASESGALTSKTENDKIFYYMSPQRIEFEIFGFKPNTPVYAYLDGVHISSFLRKFDPTTGTISANTLDCRIVSDDSGFANGAIDIENNGTDRLFVAGEHTLLFSDSFSSPNVFTTMAATTYFSGVPESRKPKPVVSEPPRATPSDPPGSSCYYAHDIEAGRSQCKSQSQSITDVQNAATPSGGTPVSVSRATALASLVDGAYRNSDVNRPPDELGMAYHVKAIESGEYGDPATITQQDLVNIFNNSPEAIAKRGNGGVCPTGTRDPLAQTFFINEFVNPHGIFVPGVDIFFSTKDGVLPVTFEIRNVENGYPGSEILFGSQVTLNPSEVVIPSDPNVPEATRFEFKTPLFLEPDEYAMVLLTNSSNYNVYIATVGDTRLDTGQSVVGQPYLGSLFKSQNATTWTAAQESDLCFVLLKCDFNTTGEFTATLDPQLLNLPTQFVDLVRVDAPFETFSDKTSISFELGLKANGASDLDPAFSMIPNSDVYLGNRKIFSATADANLKVAMSSSTADLSPILDYKNGRFIFVENLINSSSNTEVTSRAETLARDGGATSKYLTKKVTLAEGFDATDLRVILSKNLPSGASVQVFYRVQNDVDNSEFDDLPFTQMTQVTDSITSQSVLEYYDCEYKAEDITYSAGDTSFDTFRYFQIKIVLFTTNTANAPTVKNLRAIALS